MGFSICTFFPFSRGVVVIFRCACWFSFGFRSWCVLVLHILSFLIPALIHAKTCISMTEYGCDHILYYIIYANFRSAQSIYDLKKWVRCGRCRATAEWEYTLARKNHFKSIEKEWSSIEERELIACARDAWCVFISMITICRCLHAASQAIDESYN